MKIDTKKILIAIIIFSVAGAGLWFVLKNKDDKKETKNNSEQQKFVPEQKENEPIKGTGEDLKPETKTETEISVEEKAARTTVSDFEAAYKSKNKAKIFSYFTEPTAALDKETKERLLNGKDTLGNLGGPTLFETNSVSDVPVLFEFTEVKKEGSGYVAVLKETRQTSSGQVVKKRTAKLVSQNGKWLIESYEHSDIPGKYSGFYN